MIEPVEGLDLAAATARTSPLLLDAILLQAEDARLWTTMDAGTAASCLDQTPGIAPDAWCRVALETLWGPRATGPVK